MPASHLGNSANFFSFGLSKVRPDKEFRAQLEQTCGPECIEKAAE